MKTAAKKSASKKVAPKVARKTAPAKKAVAKKTAKKAAPRQIAPKGQKQCWECGEYFPVEKLTKCHRCGKWLLCGKTTPRCTVSTHIAQYCEKHEKPSRAFTALNKAKDKAGKKAAATKSAAPAKKVAAEKSNALSGKKSVEAARKGRRTEEESGDDEGTKAGKEMAELLKGSIALNKADRLNAVTVGDNKPKGIILKHETPKPMGVRPVAIMTGQDETVAAIVKVVVKALYKADSKDQVSQFQQMMSGIGDYDEGLRIASEYADIR